MPEEVTGTVVEIVVFVFVAVVEVVLGGETAFWVLAMVRVPCLSLTGKSTFAFSPGLADVAPSGKVSVQAALVVDNLAVKV